MTWSTSLEVVGLLAVTVMLVVMGLLSRRLGRVTRAAPYFLGFYLAAGLVLVGGLARFAPLLDVVEPGARLTHNVLWVLLYNGTPALGVTIGAIVAWRYWSWLLAERD